VDFCVISNAKIPIVRYAANLWFDAVCRVRNGIRRFFGISCAKRNKLPGKFTLQGVQRTEFPPQDKPAAKIRYRPFDRDRFNDTG
jgi:hypothetical protein